MVSGFRRNLREHFLKLGVQVVATARRIVLHLPQAFPYRESFHRLALSLGAQTGAHPGPRH